MYIDNYHIVIRSFIVNTLIMNSIHTVECWAVVSFLSLDLSIILTDLSATPVHSSPIGFNIFPSKKERKQRADAQVVKQAGTDGPHRGKVKWNNKERIEVLLPRDASIIISAVRTFFSRGR